jgi:hypothetical protein
VALFNPYNRRRSKEIGPTTARFPLKFQLNVCKLGIQTAECPICKNHNHCGTGVFVFCKAAIDDLIAILQNLSPELMLFSITSAWGV